MLPTPPAMSYLLYIISVTVAHREFYYTFSVAYNASVAPSDAKHLGSAVLPKLMLVHTFTKCFCSSRTVYRIWFFSVFVSHAQILTYPKNFRLFFLVPTYTVMGLWSTRVCKIGNIKFVQQPVAWPLYNKHIFFYVSSLAGLS